MRKLLSLFAIAVAVSSAFADLFKDPKHVTFKPIGFNGPSKPAVLKDDFTKDEIPYANEK